MSAGKSTIPGIAVFKQVAPPSALDPGDKGIGLVGGNLVQVNDDGSTSSIGGGLGNLTASVVKSTAGVASAATAAQVQAFIGVPANWFAATCAFVESIAPTLNTVTWSAEFMPNPPAAEVEIVTASGSAASSLLTTVAGGVLNSQTGATANSAQLCRNKNGTASPANALIVNMQTSSWAVATRAKIVATCATADLYLCGISDETVLTTYFGVHVAGTNGTTNLQLVTTASHDLGVAFTVGTYLDYLMIANGTTIQCYLGDGTGSAYVACGSPQAQNVLPTNNGHWVFEANNNATAANCACQADKAMVITASPS